MEKERRINPILIGVVCFGVIVIAVIGYSVYRLLRPNPLGNETRIDNFSSYFSNTPQETIDSIFANLYTIIKSNSSEDAEIPKNGAIIRDGSAKSEYDKELNINRGDFIVDIQSVGQSYHGVFDWSSDKNNVNLSGYTALYTCLPSESLIYGNFNCEDAETRVETEVPICNVLPVSVSEFDIASKMAIFYEISCYFESETKAKILVNDFSGRNYENALNKIRELGFDPADYTIEYNNQGGNFGN